MANINAAKFGETVKQFRTDLNMTQEELAEHIFTTRSQVSRLENGVHKTGLDRLVKICNALHCTPNELLGFDEQQD